MKLGSELRLTLSLLLIAIAPALMAQRPVGGPAKFEQVGEVVDGWSSDQHLWVKGTLPISDSHLTQLEAWLGENAPNWTVVLMQNAQGQRFQNYSGMNAVEHALGKQLANQTAFGNLKDDRIGESNGAFFILFLQERKFSYYASDAFDRRSLGENRWVGQLDKPAIAAMRGGGRIVDAVKDTITSIEGQLTRKIQAAEAAKKRAAIERARAIEEAKQLAGQVGSEIDQIEETVAQHRAANPEANGDLVTLPSAKWRGAVKAIGDYADAEDVNNARQLADQILGEIGQFRSGLERWEKDREQIARLRSRLESLDAPTEVASVQGHLARAAAALDSATENHARAESLYRNQIDLSDDALDRAEAEIEAWQAAVAAEQRRLEARKRTIQFAAIAAAVLFLIGLIVLNRLRAPAKKEARKMLRVWQAALKGKFDQLFQLMDRASIIVGPSAELKNRGYDGTTLELCRDTIHEVDELFIMSSATDSVIDRVEKLVEPKSPWGLLVNAFFSRRYRKALALLGSQPIGFDRDQGLEEILEPARKINPEAAGRNLLGDPEDYEPFRMSFEELVSAYDEKQAAAIATVDRLERCIDGLPLLLDELNARHAEVEGAASGLADDSGEDGFFPMANLRNELLPAVSGNLAVAAESGRSDPVTAMEQPANDAKRQLDAAGRLVNRLDEVRDSDFLEVEKSAHSLETFGRHVAWIDERYADLSNRGEQLSTLTIDREIGDDLGEFEDDLLRLRGRVINAAKLARRAEEETLPSIGQAEETAAATRKELAVQLSLSPQDILSEPDLSPFTRLETARKELDAARTALDRGNIEAAQEDFQEIENSLQEAADLLNLSREVATNHDEIHQRLITTLDETRKQQPVTAGLLEDLVTNYDSAVLKFSSRTGAKVRGQDSVRDNGDRAEKRLESGETTLKESSDAFAAGHLIAAGSLLERAGNEIGFARHQLSLVEDQHAALKKSESDNQGALGSLRRRHADLADSIADRRTMRPTIDQHEAAGATLETIARDIARDRPDPFAAALALEAQEKELNAIEQGIESDRTLFETAEASVTDAKRKLAESAEVVREAQTDQLPDSERLQAGMRRHHQLEEWLTRLEQSLRVDHGDWPAVQEASLEGIEEILKAKNLMEAELRAANAAADQLRQASRSLSDLQGWRSHHRVRFDRHAGSGAFTQARNALARGDYAAAQQFASKARDDSRWELSSAKSEERRKQAEADAARRRRQQAALAASSSSSFGSRSSFGGGSSFSSGSSFGGGGSGFSSGSFSSGSGVSRSGW